MLRNKIAKTNYEGALSKPIEVVPVHLQNRMLLPLFNNLSSIKDKLIEQQKIFISTQKSEKIIELFKHYKIDVNAPNATMKLILALANNHVPGFQVVTPQKKGARKKWSDDDLLILWWEVEQSKIPSARGACFYLAKKKPWSDKIANRGDDMSPEQRLYSLYNNDVLKNPVVIMVRAMLENAKNKEKKSMLLRVQEMVDKRKKASSQHY